jgi:sulfate/thiosulfate transport system permease protein
MSMPDDNAFAPMSLDPPDRMARYHKGGLPGFGLTFGFAVTYLSLIVLLPLSAALWKTTELGLGGFWLEIATPRVLAALRLSFLTALGAAFVNAVVGTLLAWVLVRYSFPGRRFIDAAIDLPFALPTAVAGIALTAIYAPNGWLGGPLGVLGIKVAFAPPGIVIALIFIGLPFVVRTVQPVLENLEEEIEEAAAILGATRWQTLWKVVLPSLHPAILTGFTLAFARGVGEYGSVVFISGNMPMRTEIAPLLIVTKLEQYEYAGATAIAVAMLGISFASLLLINLLQRWTSRRAGQTY